MKDEIERSCSPSESLKQSLLEMKLIRSGQIPKRDLNEFLAQLEQELDETKD